MLDFGGFAIKPSTGKEYLRKIDVRKYFEMMDTLIKWGWPLTQGDTIGEFTLPTILESSDEETHNQQEQVGGFGTVLCGGREHRTKD